jgi:hypothetical protein
MGLTLPIELKTFRLSLDGRGEAMFIDGPGSKQNILLTNKKD